MILDPRGPSIEYQAIVRRDDLVVELCKTRKPTRSALFDKAVLISDLLKAVSYKTTYLDNEQVNRLYQKLIEAADIFDYPVAPVLPTVTIPTVGSTIIVDGVTGVTGDVDINGSGISSINAGVIVNDDINAAAGIALSKLAALTASRALVSDGSGVVSVSAVTNTELGYLTGVTSAIQTQLNAKIGTTLPSANILVGNGSNVATAVAMTGDVTISNAGVTAIGTGVIVNADVNASAGIALSKLAALTASRAAVTDGSGFMTTSAVTATELGYVSGVTSAIQTQLNAKQATITGGATTIVSSNLTASRALASDGSGKVAVSAVTATELGYLTGVTSALQTQIDSKQPDIQFQDEGVSAGSSGGVSTVNFTGSGVTASESAGTLTVNIPGTANGLPTGGVAGNYLRKSSGTDFDATWDTFTISDVTDITATASEINALAGAGVSATEMSFLGGVTGDIQSQLDSKLNQTLSYSAIWVGNISNIATPLSVGSNGHVLTVVGGVPTWQAPSVGGTVTSVAASGGTTGMSFTGTPITTSGTLTLTGTLSLANGGTGASLSDPNADRILFWDDSAGQVTWLSLGTNLSISGTTLSSTSVSGLTSNRIVIGNSATSLKDDANLTWDDTNNALDVNGMIVWTDSNTNGKDNIFLGKNAGDFGVTGIDNIAIGPGALQNISTGNNNIVLGNLAGSSLTIEDANIILGSLSGASLTDSGNIIIGPSSVTLATTAANNIILGQGSGDNLTTGDQNIVIGSSINLPSATENGQLTIQNALYGRGNTGILSGMSTGILGLYADNAQGSWQKATFIGNVGVESTAITNGVVLYAKDSSVGSTNSTLALYTEQAVEAIGTFTPSHKLRVWINGVEYWIQLDAV